MDIDYVVGTKRFEQHEERTNKTSSGKKNSKDDRDVTIYSLTKFLHLSSQCNPNIIEVFFAPKNCILYINEYGQKLLDNVKLFVSKVAYLRFSGYAYSQERKLLTKNPIGFLVSSFLS